MSNVDNPSLRLFVLCFKHILQRFWRPRGPITHIFLGLNLLISKVNFACNCVVEHIIIHNYKYVVQALI